MAMEGQSVTNEHGEAVEMYGLRSRMIRTKAWGEGF
jgi:hypothetical protein